jgi:hypothetical protein
MNKNVQKKRKFYRFISKQSIISLTQLWSSTDLVQFHGPLFGFSALLRFSGCCFRISNFFGLSTTEETSLVEMRIWFIKISLVFVIHTAYMYLQILNLDVKSTFYQICIHIKFVKLQDLEEKSLGYYQ